MNIKKYLSPVTGIAFAVIALTSCVQKDEWDTPPIKCENKFAAPNISLADFKAQAPATGYKLITTDQIFDGYVISSDENGNFYKTISFQDKAENPTAGLQIEVDKSSNYADFPVGAHIRINAKGLRLGLDRGTVKIGSVDPTYSIGRVPASLLSRYVAGVCNGNGLEVVSIKPVELPNLNAAKSDQYINTLVKVPNSQFAISDIYPVNKTFIDYVGGAGVDTDRGLEDGTGGSATLRNSGFFSEGASLLPTGNGDITFVVSRYNTTWQMLIRNTKDINFKGNRVDATPPKGGTDIVYSGSFLENFESYPASPANLEIYPKYVNDAVLGNRYWQLKTFSGNKYIQLGANSGSGSYLTYFAVPVNFTDANTLKFDVNVGFWNGNALKVYYTTNYTPLGDITTATKVDITSAFTIPQAPTGGYGTLTPAGTYNIPASVTGNGFILFEYSGSSAGVTTSIQLDNIQVQ
ncbi:hypothetical protein H3Z85_08865 [Chryseobacterium indologenes]|uniref:DUF5689 domain-containing protein n=1 Tax=Chryseobacterium indologenes TaxID=253 RepID=UPI0003E06842|nr:DUF5689 domain-containing protein [Chryseobacterium indologenes]ATN07507.1 hypothetical protein CRN76_19970 [Chryseobacterium indologenes]AYY83754.1 hypothetical protein EGX91_03855 [Chryseobacterium indologenes]AYZ37573.1 hypothetical protein EGY07_19505 [Chryseobacterium indologenes]MBF6646446.1 hypothetical protein [Chryseobacterium indologenes]MBU3046825.1 hypothetical protein [Chryseobacterium indologenes]